MSKDISKLTEREKCELGMLYDANYSEETVKLRLKCQELCFDFNQIRPSDLKQQEEQIRKIVGKCGKSPVITAPFHCDNGFNIELGDYFYAHFFQRSYFGFYYAFRQSEFGDSVAENAARSVESFEDRDVETALYKVCRARQSCGAGAYDSDAFSDFFGGSDGFAAYDVIARKAFQRAYGDRAEFFTQNAPGFALGFLRTDSAADRRQVVIRRYRIARALEIAVFDL